MNHESEVKVATTIKMMLVSRVMIAVISTMMKDLMLVLKARCSLMCMTTITLMAIGCGATVVDGAGCSAADAFGNQ